MILRRSKTRRSVFSSSQLTQFLAQDRNGKATFIVTVNQGDNFPGVTLSSKESSNPPRLVVHFTSDGYMHTRHTSVSNNSFAVALETQEGAPPHPLTVRGTQYVGWLAIDSGQGTTFTGRTGTSVRDSFYTINYPAAGFSSTPSLLASIQTYFGIDPSVIRYRNLDSDSVQVRVQEDTNFDTEVNHVNPEVIDYLLLPKQTGIIGGIPLKSFVPSNDPLNNPGDLLWYDEAGKPPRL